jgi:hypothetical protein
MIVARHEVPGVMKKIARPSGTIERISASIVPPGRGLSASPTMHFVPGYDQPVPPGQKPFAHRGPRIKLAHQN